jgi:DNA-directed RNA polymerase specialized sigma24 family protein
MRTYSSSYQGWIVSGKAETAKVRRFEERVLVHVHDLYRAALRLTGQAPDAEDLVHETRRRVVARSNPKGR